MSDAKPKDKTKPEADDLGLIDDALEDEHKADDEIWNEIEAEEAAAANGKDPAGASAAVDADASASDDDAAAAGASVEDQLAAGIKAGEQEAGEAPSGQDDKGEQDAGEDDPADALWSEATEEQRAAFNAAQEKITKLEQSERSNRGRVSSLQRQLNDITRQIDEGASTAASGQPGDDGAATNKFLDSKDWKDFEGEYPEVAAPLGTLVSGLLTEIADQRKQLDAIGTDRRQEAVEEQTDLLEQQHEDWQDIAADPEFGTWLEEQPRHMREAAVRNAQAIVDASEAADVIGRFKAFRLEQSGDSAGPDETAGEQPTGQETTTSLSGKRKRQLEASSSARPRGAGAAHGIPADGDEEAIWDAFDKQEERQARTA